MKKELIIGYLPLLNKEHISDFANSKNIHLTDTELDIIYQIIKTHGVEILNGNFSSIKQARSQLSPKTYNHIVNLMNQYATYL